MIGVLLFYIAPMLLTWVVLKLNVKFDFICKGAAKPGFIFSMVPELNVLSLIALLVILFVEGSINVVTG